MRAIQRAKTTASTALFAALVILPLASAPSLALDQQQGLQLRSDPVARAAEHDRLFSALAAAQSAEDAGAIVLNIWTFWFQAPNADAKALMDQAMARRSAQDFSGAIDILDALVAQTPDWAEAWNQRATMRFLTKDYDGSLEDIDRVLALEPKHFGALSGEALILMRFGRFDTAQSVLRKAVEINPFLAERGLLVDEPKPDGQDI